MKGFPELSTTLGVSFRIKCIMVALHATWPPGAWWLEVFTAWPLGFPLFSSFCDWNPSLSPLFNYFCFWTFTFFLLVYLRHHLNSAPVAVFRLRCILRRYALLFLSLFPFLHNLPANFWSFPFFFLPCLFFCCLFYGFLGFKPFPYLFLLVFHG